MKFCALFFLLLFVSCTQPVTNNAYTPIQEAQLTPTVFKKGSWQNFLQHLPAKPGTILDYQGNPVDNQEKAALIVNYDVGNKDLQQCADALIRLRAEYLFAAKRTSEIAFHFTSGHLYSFDAYCNGRRPVVNSNRVDFPSQASPCAPSHAALRSYLDIVYTYAGTISLDKELLKTQKIEVGTVIILPGSPGHCTLVVDEATTPKGEKVYKLAEGYSPAQSIYILRSTAGSGMDVWQPVKTGGPIQTASCIFYSYRLGNFE